MQIEDLKRIKEEQKWTYVDMCQTFGIDPNCFCNWLTGKRKPHKTSLRLIEIKLKELGLL